MLSNPLTPYLVLAAPMLLLAVGLIPAAWANARPLLMVRIASSAAWLAFVCTLLAANIHLFTGTQAWTLYTIDLPGDFGSFSIGTYVNGVTVIMLLLVSFVGAIVTRYARHYLDGDANRGRFHKWLALTLASILTLIAASNLLLFALAWLATSLCLHQLLMFYRERPAAVLAAHKKFIASRISDISLLTAIGLIGSTLNTLEFEQIVAMMSMLEEPLPATLNAAAMLIVLSACLKSAQFPFHGWLIQVMEAPTPVSALLHAGIVNAGAFLVVRMSPIVSHSELALGTLAVVGLITLALASLVMLTQTSIKVSLAWSTTAQMGFMLLECGLGLYSLAMLHLVAHSLYKAHAFLASGSGVDAFRAPQFAPASDAAGPARMLAALITAGLMAVGVGAVFGITVNDQPAVIAAAAIVAIAMSQLLLQTAGIMTSAAFLLRGLALSALVSVTYFALHTLFETGLRGSYVPVADAAGALHTTLAVATVSVFLALLVLQQLLKHNPAVLGPSLYMHLYNGLYIDLYITRLLQRVWPSPIPKPTTPPAAFAPVRANGG